MKKTVLTFLVLVITGNFLYSQMGIPKAQAMFIFNFSRLVEWPVAYRSGAFTIGILGSSTVADELELYTKGKKVGSQDVQIVHYKAIEDLNLCHILFVPFSKSKQLPDILRITQGKSILIVTEKSGALTEGSSINFIIQEDKLKFEMKAENASKRGIKISSKLEEMAFVGS
jgi:hypothetical protein